MTKDQEYFRAHVLRDGRKVPITVWNGIKDYRSLVPDIVIRRTENRRDPSVVGRDAVIIVQVGRPVGVDGRSALHLLKLDGSAFILWARDTATYNSIVQELRSTAVVNLDGWTAQQQAGKP